MVSASQESGHALPGSSSSGSLIKLQTRCLQGCCPFKVQLEQGALPSSPTWLMVEFDSLYRMLDCRPQFVHGCWLEATLSSLIYKPAERKNGLVSKEAIALRRGCGRITWWKNSKKPYWLEYTYKAAAGVREWGQKQVESRFRTCSAKTSLTLIHLKVLNRVIWFTWRRSTWLTAVTNWSLRKSFLFSHWSLELSLYALFEKMNLSSVLKKQ